MDKKLKARWVRALRSGKYQQCRGTLHDGKGYCCFGVLVAIEKGDLRRSTIGTSGEIRYGISESVRRDLEDMNDGSGLRHRMTFKQIADHFVKTL